MLGYGTGMKRNDPTENNFVLKAEKGLKEAVLDAGMRFTEETNSQPRNRKRTEAQPRDRSGKVACSSRAMKKKISDEMQLHRCTSGAASTDDSASNQPSVSERRGETSCTISSCSHTLHHHHHHPHHMWCPVFVPPPVKQEPKL